MTSYITFQDNTRYREVNKRGTLVRDPLKTNGRDRKRRRKVRGRRLGKPDTGKGAVTHRRSGGKRSGWIVSSK